ncbi:pyridoxal kinase PdxY [Chelativorans intermedius]|uniref:pyridoxal kinase n=1 Tax=Chelativorans intermedius TaxID=515947 RepID=A0ABV6DBM0_9HYPH|nr:pyridoxal kinase PdxY [Chelativorans intermedius]MCT8999360.1 pyridoxal kinase PdxY [Chelativorans intermedius]
MSGMAQDSARRGAVIVVSSHVARGAVGNRAAVFALEALGHPVWAVPTVLLPWHPGHGPATRIVPPPADFAAFLRDLEDAPWLGEVGAVLSGYLGGAEQAEAIAALVRRVKRQNPEARYVCDPVMGDLGGLYVPQATAVAIRDVLLPLADIATPNRHELAWLAGRPLDTLPALAETARRLGPPALLVTSAPGIRRGAIGNLLLLEGEMHLAEHSAVEDPAKGPGDLTAALFLAWLMRGAPPREALRHVTAAVYETLARAAARGSDELMLETDMGSLTAPTAQVRLHRLPAALPAARR